jgi:TonB family protein
MSRKMNKMNEFRCMIPDTNRLKYSINRGMKQIIKLFALVLLVAVSCKNKNYNTMKQVSVNNKVSGDSTALVRKPVPDNFIIDSTANQANGPVYMFCETMPEFPGGKNAFNEYLRNKIVYPPRAVTDKIEGRVVVKFIVRSTGEIGDVKVLRSIREDMDKECLRVMSVMPNWKPGMISGKPVAVSYSVPVRFLLQPGESLNGIYILPPKK